MNTNSARASAAFDTFCQMAEERATKLIQYSSVNALDISDDDGDSQNSV